MIEKQKPYLIECMTFRMRGHEEASGTKYVPKELFDEWSIKDPIKNFETFLIAGKVLSAEDIDNIRAEQKQKIEDELKIGFDSKPMVVNTEDELRDVYAGSVTVNRESSNVKRTPLTDTDETKQSVSRFTIRDSQSLRFIDALKEGLHQSMQQHPNLILMGQDIAEYGGAFKITEGFVEEFGKERVRNVRTIIMR